MRTEDEGHGSRRRRGCDAASGNAGVARSSARCWLRADDSAGAGSPNGTEPAGPCPRTGPSRADRDHARGWRRRGRGPRDGNLGLCSSASAAEPPGRMGQRRQRRAPRAAPRPHGARPAEKAPRPGGAEHPPGSDPPVSPPVPLLAPGPRQAPGARSCPLSSASRGLCQRLSPRGLPRPRRFGDHQTSHNGVRELVLTRPSPRGTWGQDARRVLREERDTQWGGERPEPEK